MKSPDVVHNDIPKTNANLSLQIKKKQDSSLQIQKCLSPKLNDIAQTDRRRCQPYGGGEILSLTYLPRLDFTAPAQTANLLWFIAHYSRSIIKKVLE